MSGLELFAAALGVIAVWLTVKQNPWCWPIGLVMVLLYSWIFFEVKLYSDMLLQVVYAVLQLYGWWQWTRAGHNHDGRQVSRLGGSSVLFGLAIGAAGSLLLGAAMAHWTDAAQPGSMPRSPVSASWPSGGWRKNACNAGRCGSSWT